MAVTLVGAALAACGGIGLDSASSYGGDESHSPASGGAGSAEGGTTASSDSAPTTVATPGSGTSPLCNWKGNSCLPDTALSCNPQDAGVPQAPDAAGSDAGAVDGGVAEPDTGPVPVPALGCHVASNKDGTVGPTCGASGNDGDGRSCFNGSSCAPGSECVSATGECRRYCCDMSACAPDHFCDIQPMHDSKSPIKVPVCMPIQSACKLLRADCGKLETCSVVNETTGETSCIDVGPRGVDEECETDHCAANLVCLGGAGSRKCHKLCQVDYNECAVGELCRTNSTTFKGQDKVGVCAKLGQ